jgi:hypothetical protein
MTKHPLSSATYITGDGFAGTWFGFHRPCREEHFPETDEVDRLLFDTCICVHRPALDWTGLYDGRAEIISLRSHLFDGEWENGRSLSA